MNRWLVDLFIAWASRYHEARVVTFDDKFLFDRFAFFRLDEWPDSWWDGHKDMCDKPGCRTCRRRPSSLPWWLPFNMSLHRWAPEPGSREGFHDHPRWSVTVCLKGRITELTPWGRRELRPGSIVIRSRRYIHAFEMPAELHGETWTLFIVGRRKHRQNTYVVTPR